MGQMIHETLETPVRAACDVAVCGGGTAGVVAALAAARSGADTVLIEHRGYLGGTLVNGAGPLHSFFNLYQLYPQAGKHQVVRGIAEEIVQRLKARGQSPGHLEQKTGGGYDSMISLIDWEGYKALALEMLREAGVRLLLHTDVVGVCREGTRLTGLILQSKGGREALLCRTAVDATGDADVAALAGCPVEKRHGTTSVGMPFSMRPVDMRRLVAWLGERGLITQFVDAKAQGSAMPAIRLGFDLKRVPEFTAFMEENGIWAPLGFSLREDEFTYINGTCVRDVDATDPDALTRAEEKLRLQVHQLAALLVKHIPGFEQAAVCWTPDSVGVRLTRIVDCDHVLSLEEITGGARFPDEVFLYGFHDSAPRVTIRDGKWYGFPYRALLPKGAEGLLVAGRCVTREWEAHMSTRNTVSCMAQGQAAGTAAALCARMGCTPRELDPELLRAALRQQDVILEMPGD